jgi:hypothetical protein
MRSQLVLVAQVLPPVQIQLSHTLVEHLLLLVVVEAVIILKVVIF